MNKTSVSVDILGKSYQIKCPENEVESLKKAAQSLNDKMQNLQSSGSIINFDRVAVLAGLNLMHQIMHLEQQSHLVIQGVEQKLQEIHGKVEAALAQNAQMELVSD